MSTRFLAAVVPEMRVASLMRAYEDQCWRVYRVRRYAYNRKAGPAKSRTYATWARLAARLIGVGACVQVFAAWRCRDFLRYQLRTCSPSDAPRPPYASEMASRVRLDAFLQQGRRAGTSDYLLHDRRGQLTWDVQEGARVLWELRNSHPAASLPPDLDEIMAWGWTAMPPGFLAARTEFLTRVLDGRIPVHVATAHWEAVRRVLDDVLGGSHPTYGALCWLASAAVALGTAVAELDPALLDTQAEIAPASLYVAQAARAFQPQ